MTWRISKLLCCVMYDSCTQWYTHMWAVLRVECWFRFRFSILCVYL